MSEQITLTLDDFSVNELAALQRIPEKLTPYCDLGISWQMIDMLLHKSAIGLSSENGGSVWILPEARQLVASAPANTPAEAGGGDNASYKDMYWQQNEALREALKDAEGDFGLYGSMTDVVKRLVDEHKRVRARVASGAGRVTMLKGRLTISRNTSDHEHIRIELMDDESRGTVVRVKITLEELMRALTREAMRPCEYEVVEVEGDEGE